MKKACFLTAALALAAFSANADGYNYLTFEDNSGQLTSMSVNNLRITAADNNLVVTNADGTAQFPISALSKMYFAETSGVGELPLNASAEVVAYTTAGVRIGTFKDVEAARRNLAKGIYLFKTQGKTLKTVLE